MFSKLVILVSLLVGLGATEDLNFTYNGFQSANLSLDGIAKYTHNGLLRLTNTSKQIIGHGFYSNPINFKNSSNGTALSFSTTFVFAIVPQYLTVGGHGMAFVLAPTRGFPGALSGEYIGLFNQTNDGNPSNHVVAIKLDTIWNPEFRDINDNYVGIDINGLTSEKSAPAAYHQKSGGLKNLSLISGQPMQIWVEYNGMEKQINVTLAPMKVGKPVIPLLSLSRDLSPIINDTMYVGFSSSTDEISSSHYILGWSFKMNGQAKEFDLSQLPKLPRGKEKSRYLTIGLPVIAVISVVSVLVLISGVNHIIRRKRKFAELLEDWELDYGPHRFKYKDLYIATKGFSNKELLGTGGFGRVYRGVLPTTKIEIAVKRVSHESRQGTREFVAEIVSMGRLRHSNLVILLGYCRRPGQLLLVYDYMPNGSLDKYLYDQPKVTLNWSQRFRIIKGVASGLLYLHEEWEQVVIHRDVKAGNVLLDSELNGRLGDFGLLARLYDHGKDPQTTHLVGTLGYIAPEHTRLGKATTSTDAFAYGAFLLEVACGRKPIEPQAPTEDLILVDRVFSCWNRGEILRASDPNLGSDYIAEELELVLKLGLMCSHSEPAARPSMRQVVQYLEGDVPLPELSSLGLSDIGLISAHRESNYDELFMSIRPLLRRDTLKSSSIA